MTRQYYSTGSTLEKQMGYSRAVVQDDICFVSGMTGYDYKTMTLPEDFKAQVQNAFDNIDSVLADLGFERADIIKANYIVTDRAYVAPLAPIMGAYFEGILPAATMIVAGLIQEEMKIEIEVIAKKSA